MAIFERLDERILADRIRRAERRVLLCCPGFGDGVASALLSVRDRLGDGAIRVVIDGTDQAARLGYGHFDAVVMLAEAGFELRVEPGLRLGTTVIDDEAWCFATPPLLVDATMENAVAPNAMRLTAEQLAAVVAAVWERPGRREDGATGPEVGSAVVSRAEIHDLQTALDIDPPQRFDVAREVMVFNAFVEFVELELLGTQVTRQRVQLPAELLMAISDPATRARLTASFRLIDPDATIGHGAVALRKKIEQLRKDYCLHVIRPYGTVSLRKNRSGLEAAVHALGSEVEAFKTEARRRLEKEIDRSRRQLVASIIPAIRAAPPTALLSSTMGRPTAEQIRRWIDSQLDRVFPNVDELVRDMRLVLTIKSATYETLKNETFQEAVRAAYPMVDDLDRLFREFSAAPSTALDSWAERRQNGRS